MVESPGSRMSGTDAHIRRLEMEEKIARVNQYVYQLLGEDLTTLHEFDVGDVKLEKGE